MTWTTLTSQRLVPAQEAPVSGDVGTSRWSHEQTWLSSHERDELRVIERRLRRDGLRLDVRDRMSDWPFELAGLAAAAAGASIVALTAAAASNPVTAPLFWLGAALVLASALVAVTPIRSASRRAVGAAVRAAVRAGNVRWRFRRRPVGYPHRHVGSPSR
jgi:hypothetical protein